MSLRKKMIWDIQYLEEEILDVMDGHSSRQCAWLSSEAPRNGILLSSGLTPRVS